MCTLQAITKVTAQNIAIQNTAAVNAVLYTIDPSSKLRFDTLKTERRVVIAELAPVSYNLFIRKNLNAQNDTLDLPDSRPLSTKV